MKVNKQTKQINRQITKGRKHKQKIKTGSGIYREQYLQAMFQQNQEKDGKENTKKQNWVWHLT